MGKPNAILHLVFLLYETSVVYCNGENIGTTVTSNIAALTANAQARRAALAHFIFNTFGVIWILCIFHPFVNMVSDMVEAASTVHEYKRKAKNEQPTDNMDTHFQKTSL